VDPAIAAINIIAAAAAAAAAADIRFLLWFALAMLLLPQLLFVTLCNRIINHRRPWAYHTPQQ
jgi:uncharacterized membrane protein YhdT